MNENISFKKSKNGTLRPPMHPFILFNYTRVNCKVTAYIAQMKIVSNPPTPILGSLPVYYVKGIICRNAFLIKCQINFGTPVMRGHL